MSVKIIHPYDAEKTKVYVDASKPLLTKQAQEKETNINKIVAKFVKTGQTPVLPDDTSFGFAPDLTYHDAMNLLVNADEYFMQLPAAARTKFENDPGGFIEFVDNPANEAELREMGLLEPLPEDVAQPDEPLKEPAEPAEPITST